MSAEGFHIMSSLVRLQGVTEPEFLIFVLGAPSRDTELEVFGQIIKMWSTESGDNRQSLMGVIFLKCYLQVDFIKWVQCSALSLYARALTQKTFFPNDEV